MLTSNTFYNLAEPSKVADTSWIKGGKIPWDWWNAKNIKDVDFKAGNNQATYKHFIDFAAKHGLEYIVMDEGWSHGGKKNLFNVKKEFNMPELIEYGKSKNVGVILWR